MTTLDHTTLLAPAAHRADFAARLVNAVANLVRALKNRRAVYHLGEMSDRELSDIGLTRADLHVAWRMPLSVDPTERLGALAASRSLGEDAAGRVC